MRRHVTTSVSSYTDDLSKQVETFAIAFVDITIQLALENARANVGAGLGPGPHPHREQSPHEDTNALRDALLAFAYFDTSRRMAIGILTIDPDAPPRGANKTPPSTYGTILELGWTSLAGNTWRYPWMQPAGLLALNAWKQRAQATAKLYVKSVNGAQSRTKLSSTWQPE